MWIIIESVTISNHPSFNNKNNICNSIFCKVKTIHLRELNNIWNWNNNNRNYPYYLCKTKDTL